MNNDFAYTDPRHKIVDITDDEAYQQFVESMVPHCHCADRFKPCDGVLAGGLCDNMQDDERDDPLFEPEEYDDL